MFISPYIGNNHTNWLIFFRGVETTNQIIYGRHFPIIPLWICQKQWLSIANGWNIPLGSPIRSRVRDLNVRRFGLRLPPFNPEKDCASPSSKAPNIGDCINQEALLLSLFYIFYRGEKIWAPLMISDVSGRNLVDLFLGLPHFYHTFMTPVRSSCQWLIQFLFCRRCKTCRFGWAAASVISTRVATLHFCAQNMVEKWVNYTTWMAMKIMGTYWNMMIDLINFHPFSL